MSREYWSRQRRTWLGTEIVAAPPAAQQLALDSRLPPGLRQPPPADRPLWVGLVLRGSLADWQAHRAAGLLQLADWLGVRSTALLVGTAAAHPWRAGHCDVWIRLEPPVEVAAAAELQRSAEERRLRVGGLLVLQLQFRCEPPGPDSCSGDAAALRRHRLRRAAAACAAVELRSAVVGWRQGLVLARAEGFVSVKPSMEALRGLLGRLEAAGRWIEARRVAEMIPVLDRVAAWTDTIK